MYLAHNYQIYLLCLITGIFTANIPDDLIKQIVEFLSLNQTENGEFGILNPLHNVKASDNDLKNWKVQNTAFSLVIINKINKNL